MFVGKRIEKYLAAVTTNAYSPWRFSWSCLSEEACAPDILLMNNRNEGERYQGWSFLASDVPKYFAFSDEEWASNSPRRMLMAPFALTLLCQIQDKSMTTWQKICFQWNLFQNHWTIWSSFLIHKYSCLNDRSLNVFRLSERTWYKDWHTSPNEIGSIDIED